jgi:hypothetical protein
VSREKELEPRNAPNARNKKTRKRLLDSVNSVQSVVKQNEEFKPLMDTDEH